MTGRRRRITGWSTWASRSDQGPAMAVQARTTRDPDITVRFVSNIDGRACAMPSTASTRPPRWCRVLADVHDAETLANARALRADRRRLAADPAVVAHHFVAVSTNAERVAESASTVQQLEFWNGSAGAIRWLGHGTSLAIARRGPHAEFPAACAPSTSPSRSAPSRRNAGPHGPAGHWNTDFPRRGHPRRAALQPPPRPLPRLPAAARHGEHGKSVDRCGRRSRPPAAPCVGRTRHQRQHAISSCCTRAHASCRATSSGVAHPADRLRPPRPAYGEHVRQGSHRFWRPAERTRPRASATTSSRTALPGNRP